MTFEQLRYFVEAANHQHVGRAARSIHISPSAVSAAIAALEREFRKRLFDRKGRRVVLTRDGERLRVEGQSLLRQAARLHESASGAKATLRGTYRLAASHYLAARLLGPAWELLAREHPALRGELYSMSTADLLGAVLGGRMDIGVCFSPLRHPQLKEHELCTGQLRLAVGAGHPVAALPKAKQLAALSGYPATLHKSAPGVDVCESHPMFDMFGITPQATALFDSDDIAVSGLAGKRAWSLLPDYITRREARRLAVLHHPRGWDAPYAICAVVHAERQSDAVIKPLLRALARTLKA